MSCLRIKCSGRLIRKNDRRIIDHGTGDRNTLFLTTGKFVWSVIRTVFHSYHFEHFHGMFFSVFGMFLSI